MLPQLRSLEERQPWVYFFLNVYLVPRGFDERLKHITHGTLAFAGFDVLHLLSNMSISMTDDDGIK